jgi:hypothetical protein
VSICAANEIDDGFAALAQLRPETECIHKNIRGKSGPTQIESTTATADAIANFENMVRMMPTLKHIGDTKFRRWCYDRE